MQTNATTPPPKPAPRLLAWIFSSSLALYLLVSLTIDLNGNILLPGRDILNPAPTLLSLLALAAAATTSLARALFYKHHRPLWLTLFLSLLLFLLATL